MERLRQSELKSLHDFVRECYAMPKGASYGAFAKRLVASCLRLIPNAAYVVYCDMFPPRSESRNWATIKEATTPEGDRLWARHMNEHPALTYVLRTDDHKAARISDFWSRRQMHASGLHSELYRQLDTEDVMCASIDVPLPRVVGIAWHSSRLFTGRELLLAELIRPHIGQAWCNATHIGRLQEQVRALGNCIGSLGAGVIVFAPQGRVQLINAPARQYLAEYFGHTRQADQRLPDELWQWARQQEKDLSRTDDTPPVRSPLVREENGCRLVLRLLSQSGAGTILMEEQRTAGGACKCGSFGLTAREAEVLDWIARGKTNCEIAIILDMQPATVKKHVEHILAKLGVETRTAAAMALADSARQESAFASS